MAPFRPEEVTLPSRFVAKTCHFVAVLTVLFDIDKVVSQMTMINPSTTTNQSELNTFDNTKTQMEGLCYGAFACFAIEYVTLFMGITMFFSSVMWINILLHATGTVLVALFYANGWDFGAFVAFFVLFNCVPTVIELLMFGFVTKFSFLKY